MRYVVTADVPDANRSDSYLHPSMVDAVNDLIGLRAKGLGYTLEVFPDDGPEPSHRGRVATLPEREPLGWLQVETSQEVFDNFYEELGD